jgi:hypothetical protein
MTIEQFALANGWPTGDLRKHESELSRGEKPGSFKIWVEPGFLAATVRCHYGPDIARILIDGLFKDYPNVRATSYSWDNHAGKRRLLTPKGTLSESGAFSGYILDVPE